MKESTKSLVESNKAKEQPKKLAPLILNREQARSVITQDNIFACGLNFSKLFLSKKSESDLEFIDHYEKLRTQESDGTRESTLEATLDEVTNLPDSLNSIGDKINDELIKLIDSPTKKESNASVQKGEKRKSEVEAKSKSPNDCYDEEAIREPGFNKAHSTPPPAFNNLSYNNGFMQPINSFYALHGIHGTMSNMMIPFVHSPINMPQMSTPPAFYPNSYIGNFPTLNNVNNRNSLSNMSSPSNLLHPAQQSPVIDLKQTNFSKEASNTPDNSKSKDFKQINMNLYHRYKEMTEEELIQNSKELSKDQGGCRFLQKLLDNSPNFSTLLYSHLESDLIELINDSFGNYLIQKLIEKLPANSISKLLSIICPNMQCIGTNPHGTRVLQRLIETITNKEHIEKFVQSFSPCVITFCNDINGNHIIQKFITTIEFPKNQFIFDIIQKNIVLIGLNKHGCCALQKCIEYGTEKQRQEMINASIKHTRSFLTDQYGNYVLQNIISFKNFAANKVITESFLKDIVKLSKEKYSSNVIEKCMDYCDKETRDKINKSLANSEHIGDLLMDMYGNYVIQKALQISKDPYYSIFIENIGPVLSELRKLPFGSKLYTKFLNNYPEFAEYFDSSQFYENYYDYDTKQTNNWNGYQK